MCDARQRFDSKKHQQNKLRQLRGELRAPGRAIGSFEPLIIPTVDVDPRIWRADLVPCFQFAAFVRTPSRCREMQEHRLAWEFGTIWYLPATS
jgi:hypothetical protein